MSIIADGGDPTQGDAVADVHTGGFRALKSRLKQAPPPNSLKFYRERAGMTLKEVAVALNTTHQTIQRLETRQMILTPNYALRIGGVLGGVPGQLIAFSYAPDAYTWAAKAVPVTGTVSSDVHIEPASEPYRYIGVRNNPAGDDGIAYEVSREALAPFANWLLIIDGSRRERMHKSVLVRQNEMHRQFIVNVKGGPSYWRRIVPSAKKNCFHLDFDHKSTIYDIEIESVSEVVGFEPGLTLPTREQLEQ